MLIQATFSTNRSIHEIANCRSSSSGYMTRVKRHTHTHIILAQREIVQSPTCFFQHISPPPPTSLLPHPYFFNCIAFHVCFVDLYDCLCSKLGGFPLILPCRGEDCPERSNVVEYSVIILYDSNVCNVSSVGLHPLSQSIG